MGIITNTVINNKYDESGLLISKEEEVTKVNYKKSNDEGEYIKIYFEEIDKICKLPSGCVVLLLELSKRMSYANMADNENFGGQIIHLRKDIRQKICDELGIKDRAFFSNLKKLKDEGFIKKVSDSTYQINPSAIGRGLYEYNTRLKYGGIKDLRMNYKMDAKAETTVEDDNLVTYQFIESEIKRFESLARKEKDRCLKEDYAQTANEFRRELAKISETDYKSTTIYKRELKSLYDDIELAMDDVEEYEE
ncbi:MAG: hypothetical protein IJN64_07085 [Lachnospiraceae bacterium]|nr:hypothetical protein [Lachnospiraceae bacterium]